MKQKKQTSKVFVLLICLEFLFIRLICFSVLGKLPRGVDKPCEKVK